MGTGLLLSSSHLITKGDLRLESFANPRTVRTMCFVNAALEARPLPSAVSFIQAMKFSRPVVLHDLCNHHRRNTDVLWRDPAVAAQAGHSIVSAVPDEDNDLTAGTNEMVN